MYRVVYKELYVQCLVRKVNIAPKYLTLMWPLS